MAGEDQARIYREQANGYDDAALEIERQGSRFWQVRKVISPRIVPFL